MHCSSCLAPDLGLATPAASRLALARVQNKAISLADLLLSAARLDTQSLLWAVDGVAVVDVMARELELDTHARTVPFQQTACM